MKPLLVFFLVNLLMVGGFSQNTPATKTTDRKDWLNSLDQVARPVFLNLAQDRLKEKMPKVLSKRIDNPESRSKAAYLEAFGRTLCGIAPWLNLEGGTKEEVELRNTYRQWAIMAVANAVDSSKRDYMAWSQPGQTLVDASFVALGFIRCPWLWDHLGTATKNQLVAALLKTRSTIPVYNNWTLFTAMIETFFCRFGLDYDKVRIEYGVREFANHWYVGDGMFSDGMNFGMDYYNSYVIQPYLATMLEVLNQKSKSYEWFTPKLDKISKRYAEIQERLIASDGSYPALGRSMFTAALLFSISRMWRREKNCRHR